MMVKVWLGLVLVSLNLHAALPFSSVVPHDETYYTKQVRNTELIYTESNLPYAREAAEIELTLQPAYEKMYGYQMDEILHVGLTSKYNQIANGFSTPYPNNRQINYVGGAMMVDYFSSPSWLKTLLYHETAHNYQINAKDSPVSSSLHSVIGNGALFVPWFTVPNIVESSFLLEGNAVLNESWHGNGGRLYSGRFKAATLQQARAGYLTPERVYNNNYYFLYGSHHYTLGGYYQYYLAEKYGLEEVNSYWKQHSQDWYWPFYTNNATSRALGVNFDTSFNDWRLQMEDEAASLIDVDGEAIVSSQLYTPINGDSDEIYFIVNESGREFPELVVYDKISGGLTRSHESYRAGKVIKLADGRYVTQASMNTSPWRIYQGLFDEDAIIIEGTGSKMIEGHLSDGTEVYFDVPSSYDQPQLYLGDNFYARVNSSVFIDKDDSLYYFVQGEGKNRTLYKNKKALFTIKGYYSYVSGVDSEGAVYFIANTQHGSGLFRFHQGRMTRSHEADTIFDARLIDDDTALVAVMGTDAYSYKRIALTEIDDAPHEVVLFLENEPYYRADDPTLHATDIPAIDLEEPYVSLAEMHYSGSNIAFGEDSNAGFVYNININFADPLTQNALSAFVLRNIDEYTLSGVSYGNNQFFIQFNLTTYGILDRPQNSTTDEDRRELGLIANAYLPFLNMGHYSGTLLGSYYQDYESNSRKPFSTALELGRSEHYGVSRYRNFLLSATPYASSDRDDTTLGGEAAFEYGLPAEFFLGFDGQYSSSNADSAVDSRGVKLAKNPFDKFRDSDPSTVIMASVKGTSYFKSITRGSTHIKKVLNLSSYFFTFPISLLRETLYADYNYYDLEPFTAGVDNEQVNEIVTGINLETLWLNKLQLPIAIEYIYNDNEMLADKNTFRVSIGFVF
jgi:hypothetical protein